MSYFMCLAQSVVFYVSGRLWEAQSVVFYVSGRLWEAQFVVFYVSGRLWEAPFVVFFVSGRLSQVLGGREAQTPWEAGGLNPRFFNVLGMFWSKVVKKLIILVLYESQGSASTKNTSFLTTFDQNMSKTSKIRGLTPPAPRRVRAHRKGAGPAKFAAQPSRGFL